MEFVATVFQFILRNGRAVRRTSAGHVSFPLCLVRLFCSFPACSVPLLIDPKKRKKSRKKTNKETKGKKKKEQRKTSEWEREREEKKYTPVVQRFYIGQAKADVPWHQSKTKLQRRGPLNTDAVGLIELWDSQRVPFFPGQAWLRIKFLPRSPFTAKTDSRNSTSSCLIVDPSRLDRVLRPLNSATSFSRSFFRPIATNFMKGRNGIKVTCAFLVFWYCWKSIFVYETVLWVNIFDKQLLNKGEQGLVYQA